MGKVTLYGSFTDQSPSQLKYQYKFENNLDHILIYPLGGCTIIFDNNGPPSFYFTLISTQGHAKVTLRVSFTKIIKTRAQSDWESK